MFLNKHEETFAKKPQQLFASSLGSRVLWHVQLFSVRWQDRETIGVSRIAVPRMLTAAGAAAGVLSEPEAACQWATMSDPIRVNEVLMVVDLGGGTIDITVHRIGKRPPPECDYSAADRSYVLLDAHLKV